MAIIAPTYRLELFFDHKYVGEIRHLAENLTYTISSSRFGVDAITFSIDLNAFSAYLEGYEGMSGGEALRSILKPVCLECVVLRNNEALVGGVMIQMPTISFSNDSATLEMVFDGYANLLDGVFISPAATQTATANVFIQNWMTEANNRSYNFIPWEYHGFLFDYDSASSINLPTIQRTYDTYKSVKELIFEMCDNTEGAGEFDVIFKPLLGYYEYPETPAGHGFYASRPQYIIQNDTTITGQTNLFYPSGVGGSGILSINIEQADDFGLVAYLLGNGDTSSDPNLNTVLTSIYPSTRPQTSEYPGYRERMWQFSSITNQATLDGRAQALQKKSSSIQWQPTLTLAGNHTPPSPTASDGIWIRRRIKIETSKDPLNIFARTAIVRELEVEVSSTNSELVKPLLELEN